MAFIVFTLDSVLDNIIDLDGVCHGKFARVRIFCFFLLGFHDLIDKFIFGTILLDLIEKLALGARQIFLKLLLSICCSLFRNHFRSLGHVLDLIYGYGLFSLLHDGWLRLKLVLLLLLIIVVVILLLLSIIVCLLLVVVVLLLLLLLIVELRNIFIFGIIIKQFVLGSRRLLSRRVVVIGWLLLIVVRLRGSNRLRLSGLTCSRFGGRRLLRYTLRNVFILFTIVEQTLFHFVRVYLISFYYKIIMQ